MKIDRITLDAEFDHSYPIPYGWEQITIDACTKEKVLEIRARIKEEYNDKEYLKDQDDRLASEYGMSRSAIRAIRTRNSFKDVR